MIQVRTCARLHLGLLDNNGEHGRLYGSIGLAVNRPYLVLTAEKSESLIIEGTETERVSIYARRFKDRYGLTAGAHLNLMTSIPAHVGLGSGTQIALAVGTALARLAGLDLSTEEIALAGGRGVRSGIGIAAFRHGGFVLGWRAPCFTEPGKSVGGSGRANRKKQGPSYYFSAPCAQGLVFRDSHSGNLPGI